MELKLKLEVNSIIDKLYAKIDDSIEHDEYERGVFEALAWIIGEGEKPEIE